MVRSRSPLIAGPKKGRGKGAVIPSDPHEMLRRDNFFEVEASVQECTNLLLKEPFDSILSPVGQITNFQQQARKLIAKLQGAIKEVLRVETLISRRQNTPD